MLDELRRGPPPGPRRRAGGGRGLGGDAGAGASTVADTLDVDAVDRSTRGGPAEAAALLRVAGRRPLHVPRLPRVRPPGARHGEDILRSVPGSGLGHPARQPAPAGLAQLRASCRPRCASRRASRTCSTSPRRTRASPSTGPTTWTTSASSGSTRPGRATSASGASSASSLSAAYRQSPGRSRVLRRKVAGGARPGRLAPGQPRRPGRCSSILETLPPRRAVPDRRRRAVRDRPRPSCDLQDRQRLRLLRAARHVRPVHVLPGVPAAGPATPRGLRTRIQDILQAAFHGVSTQYTTRVSESVLARLHFIVHTEPGAIPEYDVAEIEARLVAAMRSWARRPAGRAGRPVSARSGASASADRYAEAFPAGVPARHLRAPRPWPTSGGSRSSPVDGDLAMHLYRPLEAAPGIAAVQAVPRRPVRHPLRRPAAAGEHGRPRHRRAPVRGAAGRRRPGLDLRLRAAPRAAGRPRPTGMSRALPGGLRHGCGGASSRTTGSTGWCSRAGLRVARGRRRCGPTRSTCGRSAPTFSQDYMEETPGRATPSSPALLVELFQARFDPDHAGETATGPPSTSSHDIDGGLDAVTSLDEDRILRSFLHRIVQATLRTNYFQAEAGRRGQAVPRVQARPPAQIPDLPLPRPMFEIFVYSPRVEGVHLRGGPVARGGLRWSDRPEDFRTEVLGLMKAQTVKNAVIVPVGAKGGFVVKQPAAGGDRDALQAEVVACYSDVHPRPARRDRQPRRRARSSRPRRVGALRRRRPVPRRRGRQGHRDVLRHRQRHLPGVRLLAGRRLRLRWLGGLRPQDDGHHGARRLGVGPAPLPRPRRRRPDTTTFTVGRHRGHVRATSSATACCCRGTSGWSAAFDHRHVFLDPDPDPEVSFAERTRLFGLARFHRGPTTTRR